MNFCINKCTYVHLAGYPYVFAGWAHNQLNTRTWSEVRDWDFNVNPGRRLSTQMSPSPAKKITNLNTFGSQAVHSHEVSISRS
jgi:hypothetical protein